MDNLFAGIWPSPDEKDQSTVKLSRVGIVSMGRLRQAAGVAALPWNGWQTSSGISGNLGLEYADSAILNHREEVFEEAKAKHPRRWSGDTRDWRVVKEVSLNPGRANEIELNKCAA